MSEIAARAGYSAGNLYNVFDGKEALFAEVLSSRASHILELIQVALATDDALDVVIARYVHATLELVEQHRGFFVMLMQASPDFDWHAAESETGRTSLRGELEEQLERVFRTAMERGEIPTVDPRVCCCLLQGTLNAHVARWVRQRGTREELWGPAEELRRLVSRAVGI
jgi:AcrR family transcriptional regulator